MPFPHSSTASDAAGENRARRRAIEKIRTDIEGRGTNLRQPAACVPAWYRPAYHF